MSKRYQEILHNWISPNEHAPRVFISYSHDDFGPYLDRFAGDLIDKGISVWIDRAMLTPTVEWEEEIEKGIVECDYFLFFMSKLSIRRPDGYCIKEISFAQQNKKIIIPIKIEDIPPLIGFDTVQLIPMLNTFKMKDEKPFIDEAKYQDGLEMLLDFVLNKKSIASESGFKRLYECLKPIPQSHYFEDKKVHGYDRIKKELDDWIDCDLSERYYQDIYTKNLICYLAKTGSGKTTFISDYCRSRDDIVGIHFCRSNSNDRGSAKRILMTLSYSLATRLPEYRMILNRIPNLEEIESLSTSSVYETLFILPFSNMKESVNNIIFIIDGLDEGEIVGGDDNITDFITKNMAFSNSGLRFILTTRPEESVLSKLKAAKGEIKTISQSDEEIDESIKMYLRDRLKILVKKGAVKDEKDLEHYIDIIIQKAEHSFVYATSIAKELLAKEKVTIEDINILPQGIMQMYYDAFQKIFFSENKSAYSKYMVTYEQAKEVLKVLVAQYQRLTLAQITKFLKSNKITNSTYVLTNTLGLLSSFFSVIKLNKQESKGFKEGMIDLNIMEEFDMHTVEAVHTSLIDWLISKNAAKFQIALDEAHYMMAAHYEKEIEEGNLTVYTCNFYISHLIGSDEYKKASDYITDYSFQKSREKIIGKTPAIENYLKELFMFAKKYKVSMPILMERIFDSKIFHEYIGEYRKVFYNQNSTYKKLKDTSFSAYADKYIKEVIESPTSNLDFEFVTAIIDYNYINELYVKVTKYAKQITSTYKNIPDHILVELYKMICLSYRKRGNLEQCFAYAKKCSELNEKTGFKCNYDVGVVNLIVGKTYYHCLDFESGEKQIQLGIEQLLSLIKDINIKINDEEDDDFDEDYDEDNDEDIDEDFDEDIDEDEDEDFDDDKEETPKPKKVVKEENSVFSSSSYDYFLFITYYTAAFHRELALLHLWNSNYEAAKKEIEKIEEIYDRKDYVIDRYYVRYLYSKSFYQILTGNYQQGVSSYSNTFSYAVTAYEKSQVLFITALGHYLKGDLESASAFIKDAINIVESKKNFEIYEKGEIYILNDIINGKADDLTNYDNEGMFKILTGMSVKEAIEEGGQYNQYNINALFNWYNHVFKFILKHKKQ